MTMKFHPQGFALLTLAVLMDRIYPHPRFTGVKADLIDETVRRGRRMARNDLPRRAHHRAQQAA